jgi:hypothetical protein
VKALNNVSLGSLLFLSSVSISLSVSLCLSLSLNSFLPYSKHLCLQGQQKSASQFLQLTPGCGLPSFSQVNLPALMVLGVTNSQVFHDYNYLFLIISSFSMFSNPDDLNYLCYLPLPFSLLYD